MLSEVRTLSIRAFVGEVSSCATAVTYDIFLIVRCWRSLSWVSDPCGSQPLYFSRFQPLIIPGMMFPKKSEENFVCEFLLGWCPNFFLTGKCQPFQVSACQSLCKMIMELESPSHIILPYLLCDHNQHVESVTQSFKSRTGKSGRLLLGMSPPI